MTARSYSTIDKTGWGDGPWQDEPDKLQWPDEATGLPCLAVRNRQGAWCGYVGVPPGHRLHGAAYDDVDVDVHGGLTYAAGCADGPEATSICHVPAPGEPDDVWWFGFDCHHAFDLGPAFEIRMRELRHDAAALELELPPVVYRTLGYVQDEVRALAAQLAEATPC